MSFTTDDGLIGIRGLYNFGQDFDDSYEDMLNESRHRRLGGKQTEEIILNNRDSGFIELEQESGESASAVPSSSDYISSATSETSTLESLRTEATGSTRSGRTGYLGEDATEALTMPSERIRGYWSVGAEIYYSATEKLGGGKLRPT